MEPKAAACEGNGGLWASIRLKFCGDKKQKFLLERELNTIHRVINIAQKYVADKNYQPSEKELELFNKLARELCKNYCAAKQIANYMQHKNGKLDAKQNIVSAPLDDDSWFLL